jgi:hypothetical protein
MPNISKRFVIAAPAAAVWEVIGPGFANIGQWATAIPGSTGLPHDLPVPPSQTRLPPFMAPGLTGAPVAGRVCATGLALVPEVTETLVAYDQTSRSLTYEAGGMPSFVTIARNTWTVTALDEERRQVTLDARLETRASSGLWPGGSCSLSSAAPADTSATIYAMSSSTGHHLPANAAAGTADRAACAPSTVEQDRST